MLHSDRERGAVLLFTLMVMTSVITWPRRVEVVMAMAVSTVMAMKTPNNAIHNCPLNEVSRGCGVKSCENIKLKKYASPRSGVMKQITLLANTLL